MRGKAGGAAEDSGDAGEGRAACVFLESAQVKKGSHFEENHTGRRGQAGIRVCSLGMGCILISQMLLGGGGNMVYPYLGT